MKKFLLAVFTTVFCFAALSVFSVTALAQENVSVRIAPYYTEIDYMSVYNPAVEFPLITYKDITYFPMTYNLCARLGIATGFHESAGLYITRHDVPIDGSATGLFGGAGDNSYGTYYDAVIPEYPVYLNGVRIDNTKEEYPLINFRGITYFPMTWHFAVEELGFTTEWSAETGFKLYRDHSPRKDVLIGKSDKDGINITFSTYSPDKVENPDGSITVLQTKQKHERYKLMYEYGYAKKLGSSDRLTEDDYREIKAVPECDKIFFEDGYLRYMSTRILDLTGIDATSQFSREYSFDGISFIHTIVEYGNSPAPYNKHNEYIFVRKNGNITKLEWDEKNNLTNIFPDGYGGYYLCSDHYSPANTSRWNTDFACVYRYTSSGEFYEMTVPDTNSLTAIGTVGTKLYVKAMYYAGDKSMAVNTPLPISTINSGYYEIDTITGNARKLYAYVPGKTFIGENGKVYLITTYGASCGIIELSGGKVIRLDQ